MSSPINIVDRIFGPHTGSPQSDLALANQSDIAKFKATFNISSPDHSSSPSKTQGSPFDFQPNRITSLSKTPPPTMGSSLLSGLTKIMNSDSDHTDFIQEKFDNAGDDAMHAHHALELQFRIGNLHTMTEVVSKGVSKIVQAAQTVVKNQ